MTGVLVLMTLDMAEAEVECWELLDSVGNHGVHIIVILDSAIGKGDLGC